MNKMRWALFGVSLVVLIVLGIIFFRGEGQEKIKPAAALSPSEKAPVREQPGEIKYVTLFFLSDEDGRFHREQRRIAAGLSVIQEAEEVVEDLISGSEKGFISCLPPETKLRQLFVTKDGTAYVDFSKELTEKLSPGSSSELAAVYSVVNSLTYNFAQIKKVFILIEGGEKETLGGHVSLSRAFAPFYSLNVE